MEPAHKAESKVAATPVAAAGSSQAAKPVATAKLHIEATLHETGLSRPHGESVSGEDNAGRILERNLATVTRVESGDKASTYSFSVLIRYKVSDDRKQITILGYSARGIFVDGLDLGAITARNIGEWVGAVKDDQTFVVSGKVAWSNRFNQALPLLITFRGTLCADNEIGFVSNTTQGEAHFEANACSVLLDIPACW